MGEEFGTDTGLIPMSVRWVHAEPASGCIDDTHTGSHCCMKDEETKRQRDRYSLDNRSATTLIPNIHYNQPLESSRFRPK